VNNYHRNGDGAKSDTSRPPAPVRQSPTDVTQTTSGRVPAEAKGRRSIDRLLLVVEDNPGDARLLREMFAEDDSHNTEVIHMDCMVKAEKHLLDHAVDIILLDLGLPDAQGLEAVRRAHAAAPNVPLVVLTGLDDESLAVQALQEGAQDYLIKGQIEARGLLRALRYAIERKVLEDAGKASENQLLQAQKLESIGRLAGGVAHDFNNMLFAIRGYAELLGQDLASMDPVRLDPRGLMLSVSAISEAAERATALTAQLLAFSRQQMVTAKVLDLNEAVTKIEPMLNQLIGENTRLILKLDPAAGRICADASQIDQIIVNLVVNARDAMPNGGMVTIETGTTSFDEPSAVSLFDVRPGPFVLLSVTDTGVGIDRATREHMFEPFFTTKDVGKGTGLGLATTYGIVRQAGGDIRVQSELGRGTVFKLYFPRVDGAVEERPIVPVGATIGVGRAMIVEDDPSVRDITRRFLERAGYDVVAMADGVEAVAAARAGPPFDVLVTDVVMPNMSGIDLAEQMMDLDPLIAVVLLSGYTAEHLDLEGATARGATFVPKPVTSNQLLQAVVQGVAQRHAVARTLT
jgi:two-component system cell cycle sensor histidine kinase/response regulator CckA